MSIFDEIAADSAEILADIGRPVVFRGATVSAIVSDAIVSDELGIGGFSQSGSVSVKLQHAAFASNPPKDGEKLQHAGISYRIASVSFLEPSAWYDLRVDPVTAK